MRAAVIAHAAKILGTTELSALRPALAAVGIDDPLWAEIDSSKSAPKQVRKLLDAGADFIFAWGGDGTVQRVIDTVVKEKADVPLAILPAGTANLLATNLGIAAELERALAIAIQGERKKHDVGRINGEHFAVMAGLGFDARMIADARGRVKKRLGKAAYVWTGLKNLRKRARHARITVDGEVWYDGPASMVLFGNVGTVLGGLKAFPDAQPDDGRLEVAVVRAENFWEWVRVATRVVGGDPDKSPLVELTAGERIVVELDEPLPYELDGGARDVITRAKVRVKKDAVTICVPHAV